MIKTDDILRRLGPHLQRMGDAIVVTSADIDPPGPVVLFVNRAFTELTDFAPDDVIGHPLSALRHSNADQETLSRLKHTLIAHRCFSADTAGRRKDGSAITLEWHAVPLCDEAGEVRCCVNLFREASRSRGETFGTDVTGRRVVAEGEFLQEELTDHLRRRTAELNETILRLHEQIAERLQVEEALRESERRLRDFASSSSDWFWEMGADLRFTWLSDQFEQLTGISPSGVIGGTRDQLGRSSPGDADWTGHLDDLHACRPFRDFRYRAWRDDGGEVYFSVSGVPVFDGEGHFQGYRGTGTNITAEVQAEKQATEARVLLGEAIESIPEGFSLFDADDRLVLFNTNIVRALPGIADILTPGARFEDLVRAVAERGYIVEAIGRTEDWVQERLAQHRALASPLEQHFVDGQWTQVNEYRTRDGGTLLVRTDITHRKKVEEALRRSEERFQLAVSGTRDGLWDRDLVTDEVWYSPVWRQIIGLDETEMERYVWRDWVHPDDLPRAIQAMEDYFARKTPIYQCTYRHRHRDGHWIWIEARATCVRDDKGVPIRYTGRFSDISQRIEVAERSRKLQSDLEHVARLNIMGEMAAGIAHELHQPLTAITNYVQTSRDLLEDVKGTGLQTVYEAMDRAVDQCQRAGQVIRRLREFMGKGETRRGLQDINAVIEESAALALVGATENKLELNRRLEPGLPAVFIDKVQIQQVVANLVKNALDAMALSQHRKLTLRTSRCGADAVEVEISDTGPGIAANVADRLFEPFVTTKPEGMGIGLSICRSIIEDHQGHLAAHANEDGGATLRFTLPIGSTYAGRDG